MSVTFYIVHNQRIVRTAPSLNLANVNAADLLRWLDLPYGEYQLAGEISPTELAARCRRRLWDVARNWDPELPERTIETPDLVPVTFFGRRAGFLREMTAELLRVAESAGEGLVAWA